MISSQTTRISSKKQYVDTLLIASDFKVAASGRRATYPSSVATYQDPPTSALRIDPTSSSPKASCERTAGPYMRMRSQDRPGFVFMACSSKAHQLALLEVPPRLP